MRENICFVNIHDKALEQMAQKSTFKLGWLVGYNLMAISIHTRWCAERLYLHKTFPAINRNN